MAGNFVTVGSKFPAFSKRSVVSTEKGKEFRDARNKDIEGRWAVMFWWPNDFSFICPTEIVGFNKHYADFAGKGAVLLGASTDSEYAHLAWRKENADFHDLQFPMISDASKSLARELGILSAGEEVALRTTYIIDPEGTVRWLCINDLTVGRNIAEVLRVLDALQTDEMCPCDWEKGKETLTEKAP